MEKIPVALLGVGTMGKGMAANLLKAGFPLTVYNRTAAKAEALAAEGARVAHSPAEAAGGARIILSMLSDDSVSREAWTGTEGALAAAEPGTILIESSTVSPAWIAELAGLAKGRDLEFLDAPVTGSRAQAEGGQLKFLVGGSEQALASAMPALQAMGTGVVHLGPITSGAKMKLLNNFLCGVQVASLAEGIAWLERSGLDRDKALEVLKSGAPGSPLLSAVSARMTSPDRTVNFMLSLMEKDLAYAHAAAKQSGVELTTASNARQLFARAWAAGHGDSDMSTVVEVLRHPAKP